MTGGWMSQTLMIEGDDYRGALLSLNLQIYTGTNIIWKNSIEEAIEVLKVLPELNLIVALDENAGEMSQLFEYLNDSTLEIPTLSREKFESYTASVSTGKKFDLQNIIETSSRNLGISKIDMARKVVPDFFPISIENFHFLDEAPCDIFIKLKKTQSDFRFVKRISAFDQIDHEGIDRYIINGVNELFILKQDRFKFIEKYSQSLIPKLNEKFNEDDPSEYIQKSYSAFDIVNKFFTEDVEESDIELIEANIQAVNKICQSSQSQLSELIEELLNSSHSYRYQLMVLTNYLGIKALKKMDNLGPVSILKNQIEKFSQACFLHDLLLKTDDQVRVRCEEDMEKYNISERELVLSHALKTSQIIKEMNKFDSEVQRIVLEQHGKPTGTGFSYDFSNRLHPLTHVLMACEAYAHELLSHLTIKSYDEIIKNLPPVFLKKEFWKVLTNIK